VENVVLTSVETAGEIKGEYPHKKVTIVQGDRLLLSDVYPDRFRLDVQRRLEKLGVQIILNDAIKGNPPPYELLSIRTRDGKDLPCDLLVSAFPSHSSALLSKSAGDLSWRRRQHPLPQIPHTQPPHRARLRQGPPHSPSYVPPRHVRAGRHC